jgi:E3 ubiquitin-protein ligase RAD18
MCNKSVKFKNINPHMDNGCKDTPPDSTRSSEWAKIMGGKNKGKQKSVFQTRLICNNILMLHYREIDDVESERLPKVSYGTLKDKKLKEMLAEHNLATHGDRNLLIQRHQRSVLCHLLLTMVNHRLPPGRWVMLFNSNLDRSSPTRKSKPELRKELKKWEDERVKKKKFFVEDELAHEVTCNCLKVTLTFMRSPARNIINAILMNS